jgi:hypothetical protein
MSIKGEQGIYADKALKAFRRQLEADGIYRDVVFWVLVSAIRDEIKKEAERDMVSGVTWAGQVVEEMFRATEVAPTHGLE